MSINNINGLNSYYSALLNQQGSQNSYGQSQDSLFGNNILTPNVNNFNTVPQNNSNSLLQMLLPLLINLLTGQQNTQTSTINNTSQAQASVPVNNANIIQDQPVVYNSTQQNTKKLDINNALQDRLSVSVNNSKVKNGQPVKNNQAVSAKAESAVADVPSTVNTYYADGKLKTSSIIDKRDDKGTTTHLLGKEYDANGKVIRTWESTKAPQYNSDGRVITSSSTASYNYYDEEGNVTKSTLITTKPDGTQVTTDTDKDGNIISKNTKEYNTIENGYEKIITDKDGKVISKTTAITDTDKDGKFVSRTTKSYDGEGNVTGSQLDTVNANNKIVITKMDKDGKVISEITTITDAN